MPMKDTIAAIRKEAGLTQEEMARRLYVTRQAISRWEQGTTEPASTCSSLSLASWTSP